MAEIHHQITIDAPPAKVYDALATAEGISRWWSRQTAVQTDSGTVLEHNPGPEHGVVRMRVAQLVPDKRVEWECISSHPSTSPASAWTGTRFIFEMAESNPAAGSGPATTLDFYHTGYDELSEYYDFNVGAWAHVLRDLKRLVESQRT